MPDILFKMFNCNSHCIDKLENSNMVCVVSGHPSRQSHDGGAKEEVVRG